MRRFTLVEMLTVVAITAVLAALAVPRLAHYQANARLVEPELTFDALWPLCQAAWHDGMWPSENLGWSTGWTPRDFMQVDKAPHPWGAIPENAAKFAELGFEASGPTRCAYMVNGIRSNVNLGVNCDLNGDGVMLGYAVGLDAVSGFYGTISCRDLGGAADPIDSETSGASTIPGVDKWYGQLVYDLPCR